MNQCDSLNRKDGLLNLDAKTHGRGSASRAVTDARPLRILYSFSDTFGMPGGIGSTAWYQVTGLIEAGAQVTVLAPRVDARVPRSATVVETLRWGPLRLPARPVGPYRPRRMHDRRVAAALRRMAPEVDLVHCWPVAALETLRTARALGIPSFLERQNTHTRSAFEIVAREYENLGLPLTPDHSHTFNSQRLAREEAEYAAADWLLCPSETVVRSFVDQGFAPDRLVQHRYGYDATKYRPAEKPTDESDGRGLHVAFVASCEPRKGLHYALRAWVRSSASRSGKFHICGRFVPGYRELLADVIDHPSVVDEGYVSDVPGMLQRCDVLVIPSIEEGSPLVGYEARGSGCVPVVADAAGTPVDHMRDGLVHPVGDVDTLTEHFNLLNHDRELFVSMRRRSIETASSYTWSAAAERLIRVYRDCLATAGPSAGE